MKVLVCGSRGWVDEEVIVDRIREMPSWAEILHGSCPDSPDMVAAKEASRQELIVHAYPAEWSKYGKKAGIIRNLEMLDQGPELVLAFWDGESRGTKHTIDQALKRKINVEVVFP
jgi:hypothetical protein